MAIRLKRGSNSSVISIDSTTPLRTTRDGILYPVGGSPGLVAKIYRQEGNERIPKLVAMIDNPPNDATINQDHLSISWPIDLLYSSDMRDCVGFLSLRQPVGYPLHVIYNPISRRRDSPLFNYRYLCRTAQNLAGAITALHSKGYVLGDINDQSAVVTATALITLLDTDTYQVFNPKTRITYRCLTGRSEFMAPELQGVSFEDFDREPAQDNFSLAILIFLLLMEGTHPFSSSTAKLDDENSYKERIEGGLFLFGRSSEPTAVPENSMPFSLLPLAIRELFKRCFDDGDSAPLMRPSSSEWQSALQEMEGTMVACAANDQHLYPSHLKACPWCERIEQLGVLDPFPSRESIEFAAAPKRAVIQVPLPSAAEATKVLTSNKTTSGPRPAQQGRAVANSIYSPSKTEAATAQTARTFLSDWRLIGVFGGAIALVVITMSLAMHRTHNAKQIVMPPVSATQTVATSADSTLGTGVNQQAKNAQQILDTVTLTIEKDQHQSLNPEQARTLRSKLINECFSAELDTDQAIRIDNHSVLAWQERIRGYRLLADTTAANKASKDASIVFSGDPIKLAMIYKTAHSTM